MGQWLNLDKLRPYYKPIIQDITSVQEMREYLLGKNDVYTKFILEMIELELSENSITTRQSAQKQVHHIFPTSIGGPDDTWNKVSVTFEQHYTAHALRYEAYNEIIDDLFIRLREKQTAEAFRLMTDLGRATQKKRKIEIYDLSKQSARGKIGGSKQTEEKRKRYRQKLSDTVAYTFTQHVIWQYLDKETSMLSIVRLPPKEISLVRTLFDILDKVVPFKSRLVSSGTSGLARVMKGQRSSHCGWSIVVFSTAEEVDLYLATISEKISKE